MDLFEQNDAEVYEIKDKKVQQIDLSNNSLHSSSESEHEEEKLDIQEQDCFEKEELADEKLKPQATESVIELDTVPSLDDLIQA